MTAHSSHYLYKKEIREGYETGNGIATKDGIKYKD